MGVATAAIAGKIITSYVASRVASRVASKIGMSDDMSMLVGLVAAGYAGAQVPMPGDAAAMGSSTPMGPGPHAPSSGVEMSAAPSDMIAPESTPLGAPPARGVATGNPVNPSPGVGPLPQPGNALGTPNPQGGMLSQASSELATETVATPEAVKTSLDSNGTVDKVVRKVKGEKKTSWMERLLGPDRVADMAIAGINSMAQADQKKDEYKRDDDQARKWVESYGGEVNTMTRSYPSGGG
jgi:hypothetical protein